jgi:hypothetical protein
MRGALNPARRQRPVRLHSSDLYLEFGDARLSDTKKARLGGLVLLLGPAPADWTGRTHHCASSSALR